MECSQCKSQNVTVDHSRNELICDDCGCLTEQTDNNGETEFEEMDNGKVVAVGNLITTGELASKQNTVYKASTRIKSLCSKLMLTQLVAAYAVSIFKTALLKGMTRGRSAYVTAGACVYLAARMKKQSLMMIDVSDKINVSVYVLGKTYNELKEKTGQRVPNTDPSLFVSRFAQDMELGDKTEEVALLANKFLQRMKKDWISTGRRPSGIAACALLISARALGFDRNLEDVSKIAGVSKHTTKKRVQEWAQTPSADLTLSQTKNIEFEDEVDPPAFTNQKIEEIMPVTAADEADFINWIKMFNDESKEHKREKLEGKYYQSLVDSLETGEMDDVTQLMHLGLGGIDEDGDDSSMCELDGRKELWNRCLGTEGVFNKLRSHKKKEEIVVEGEEDELPVYLACAGDDNGDEEGGGRDDSYWAQFDVLDNEDDDEELERVYLCSKEESMLKMKWFFGKHKDYYKDQKKSLEKRTLLKKREKDTGKKTHVRRKKRQNDLPMVDHHELLKEIKASRMTPENVYGSMKIAAMDDGGDSGRVEEREQCVEEDMDEEEEEEDGGGEYSGYKHEQMEEGYTSDHCQYDYGE